MNGAAMGPGPRLTVLHRLPGRVRLRVDSAAPEWNRIEKDLRGHTGIEEFRFSEITRTMTVRYDRAEIAEAEVVVRAALSLAVAADLVPVRVERTIEGGSLETPAVISGGALIALGITRFLPGFKARALLLDAAAAAVVGGSVLVHAIREMREDGTFHPETLSVVYLAVSLAQGNGFTGAVLSWLASYGRHFKGRFVEELVVRAEPAGLGRGRRKRYEMTLERGKIRLAKDSMTRYIPALIAHAVAGGKPGDDSLLEDIEAVSADHHHMLEGLEGMTGGISMQIRKE